MAMIMYLAHVEIIVKDMDRAIDFYTKLGFSVLTENEDPIRKVVFVGNGLAQLELFAFKKENAKESPPPKIDGIGINHIALHVDDLESAIERLKKRGVEFTSEITKKVTETGKISFIFLRDPDGTRLQLFQGSY